MNGQPSITYAEACLDPHLFGPWFSGESWAAWRVLDKALFGEPLDADELAVFRELTGWEDAPTSQADEAWFIVGRRGGKDVKAASLATYLATIGAERYGYRQRLTRGERGVVQVLAVDRDQAAVCLNYLKAFFEQPMLAKMVKRPTADSVELTNGMAVEITTNDKRRVRGRTVIGAVFDEVAHWRSEATANPDEDVYQAVKPAMATMPGAMLVGITSPYARRGLAWRKYREHYGKPGSVLVVKAPTWRMNPTVPRDGKIITEAFESDPVWAASEYGAEFRTDIEAYVPREALEACIERGVYERRPNRRNRYIAFVDPSGGSNDSMTLAIAHREGDRETATTILDAVREVKPPFSPEAVVLEFAELCRSYRITRVYGDRYAGEWPREQFRKHGVLYEVSGKPKSQLYVDALPLINSSAVDLLDNDRLVQQFTGLERRTARGGRDSIDHPPGGHDDLANAVAGVLAHAQDHRPRADVHLASLPQRTNSAMSNSRYLAGSFRQAANR